MAFTFPALTADNATSFLSQVKNAMMVNKSGTPPTDGMMPDIPGVFIDDVSGMRRPLCHYRWDITIWYQMLISIVDRVQLTLPARIADGIAKKAVNMILRATESFNMTTDVLNPGDHHVASSLQLENEVNSIVLIDIACDPLDAKIFNCQKLNIGASVLIPQGQLLNPASDYAGLTLGVWQTDGAEYNDVMPEFGITYATNIGKAITIDAEFCHKRTAGYLADPAMATLSFLCIANRRPRNCAMNYNAADAMAALPVCRI